MKLMRGIVNAVLMATLLKPVARRMVGRWRTRTRESAATAIGIPVQELFETALIEELVAPATGLEPSPVETPEQLAGRGVIRTMFIAGALIALTALAAVAIAALIRRRREAREAQAEGADWVAVPVEGSIKEAEEAVAQEALIE